MRRRNQEAWQYQKSLGRRSFKHFDEAESDLLDARQGVAVRAPSAAAILAPSSREREPAAAESPGDSKISSEAGEEDLAGYMAARAPSGRASRAAAPSAAAGAPENYSMASRDVSGEEFEAESVPDPCAFIPGHDAVFSTGQHRGLSYG